MSDTPRTDDTAALTRRAALAAGAAGVAGLALTSEAAGATRVTAARYNRTVIVHAPKEIVFDLEKVLAIQEDLLGQLGCRACCSGFDFHFPTELEFIFPAHGVRPEQVSPEAVTAPPG